MKTKPTGWWLLVIPVCVILYVFRNVIFFGGIYANQDVIYNYLPYYLGFIKGNYIEHAILGGFPIYTTMQATWFSPITKALVGIFSPANAYIFANIAYVMLAFIFTYLYAKKVKMSHEVSILAGLMYIFSGQVMLWSHVPFIVFCHFLLPASLYLLEEARSRKIGIQLFLFAIVGALFGLGWITGHAQFNVYVQTFFGIYLFFVTVVWNEKSWSSVSKFIGICIIVFGISFVVGLPQIDAVLATQPYTLRSEGVDISQHYGLGYMPYTIIQYILPSFRIFYPPVAQSFHNYIGLLPLTILIVWFVSLRKKYPKIEDKRYAFFIVSFIIFFILAIYKSPLAILTHYIPLYNSFREAVRMMLMGDFALAVIFGYIVQTLVSHGIPEGLFEKSSRILKKVALYIIVPLVTLATLFKLFFFEKAVALLTNFYVTRQYKGASGNFPLEHYTKLIRTYLDKDLTQLTLFSFHVVSMLVILFLVYLLLKRAHKLSRSTFITLAIVIVSLDFALAYSDRFPIVPKAELFTRGKVAELIEDREVGNLENFRYISVFGEDALWRESVRCSFPDLNNWNISPEEFELRKELLDPNFNVYFGLQSIDGYEPYMVRHISDVVGYVGSRLAGGSELESISALPNLEEKVSRLIQRKNILRSLNVKYIVSPMVISDKDFVLIGKVEVGECKSSVFLYELTNVYPRFYMTKNVIVGDKASAQMIMSYLESSDVPLIVLESNESTVKPSSDPAVALMPIYKGNSLIFTIPKQSSVEMFHIGLTWMPGWHVKIDGVESKIFRINHWAMGLEIPSGAEKVELYYERNKHFNF